MLFSERLKLEKEYYEWVGKTNAEFKAKGDYARVKDCPQTVISFLQGKGLSIVKDDEVIVKKEQLDKLQNIEKKIENGEFIAPFKHNTQSCVAETKESRLSSKRNQYFVCYVKDGDIYIEGYNTEEARDLVFNREKENNND